MKIVLLILCSPIWIISRVAYAVILLLMTVLGWIPFIGSYITIALMFLLVPLYPILAIYGLNVSSLGKEKIQFIDDGFLIEGKRKSTHVKWDEIEKLYDVFNPPGFSYNLELKNGTAVKLNPFTEIDMLKIELGKRNIEIDIQRRPSRGT